jgi:hypothetical protein
MKQSILEFSGIRPVQVHSFGPVVKSSAAKRAAWIERTRWALMQAYDSDPTSPTVLCCGRKDRQATRLSFREAPRDQGIRPQTAAGRMHRPVESPPIAVIH